MRLHRLQIPLRAPFRTASGTVDQRDLILVEAVGGTSTGERLSGWGEAAPFPGQDEPIDVLLAEAGVGRFTNTLRAAIDQADSDLAARTANQPLGDANSSEVPISVAIGLADPVAQAVQVAEQGVKRFKLKVAPGSTSHVTDVRRELPDAVIGLDANRSFADSDVGQLWGLAKHDIAYIEEPFVQWDERGAGRLGEAGIPLFADESISRLDDVLRLLLTDFVDGVTIKPGRLGWTGALQAIDTARRFEKRWRASGLLETAVGRSFTNRLAARSDAFVSDVAPASWFFEADVVTGEQASNGNLVLGSTSGTGIDPDPQVIDRYRVATYELGS